MSAAFDITNKIRATLLLLGLSLAVLALGSCSSEPKMGMGAQGEPVEHKVFYEGWLHPQ